MLTATAPGVDTLGLLQSRLRGLYRPWRLGAVLLLQAALWAGHVTDSWHAGPDSALYLSLARSLAEGRGYTFNYEFHAMVPPGYPLLLSGVMRLFGASYLVLNATQVVLGLACTPLAFLLLSRWFGKDMGLLGAGLLGLSFAFFDNASAPTSDILFALVATGAMLVLTRATEPGQPAARQWTLCAVGGVLNGAAALVRVNAAVIAPGAVVAIWLGWRPRPRLARAAAAAAVLVLSLAPLLAWQEGTRHLRGAEGEDYLDASYLSRPLGQMVPQTVRNVFVELPGELSDLVLGLGGVPPGASFLIPVLAGIGCAVCLRRRIVLLPIALLGMAGLLAVVPGVRTRYLLFLAPGLFVLVLVGATWVALRLAPRRVSTGPGLGKALLIATAVLAAIHLGHSAGDLMKYRRGEVPGGHRIGSRQGWFTACRYILEHAPPPTAPRQSQGGPAADGQATGAILTRHPSLVHYLTRAKVIGTKALREHTVASYQEMILRHRPRYLLSEKADDRTAKVLQAIRQAGAVAEEVEGLPLTGTITLWRIRFDAPAPPGPPSGPAGCRPGAASPAGIASSCGGSGRRSPGT